MRLRGRSNRLERAYPERVVSKANSLGEFADEDWLAYFEELGRMGCLAREPDFPIALASYRGAIRDAKASIDPPWEPSATWNPYGYSPQIRLLNWRRGRFPMVEEGRKWLAGMLQRLQSDIPPVTEAEMRELAAWLRANASHRDTVVGLIDVDNRHLVRTDSGTMLTMGARYKTGIHYLLHKMDQEGAKAFDAGSCAEAVRKLVAQSGANGGARPVPLPRDK